MDFDLVLRDVRLADAKHMRMSGYSARVRSLSWSAEGEFLATSGSEQLILWPFDGKDGPMGRQPTILARAESRVAVVACHPRQPVVAVGHADGAVRLVRVEDDALILAREADGQAVSALGEAYENPSFPNVVNAGARTALAAGHDVDVFVAGDGVSVLRPEMLDIAQGVGTGSLREHVDALVAGGATFYASAMSSNVVTAIFQNSFRKNDKGPSG
jgi:WD40 repeat protein